MLKRLSNYFTKGIAIDLGTANTLLYIQNVGIVINEPSIVAISTEGEKAISFGEKAKVMLGKNPDVVKVINPLKDGVIANFKITELMLRDLLMRAQKRKFLIKPKVIVCVPSGITEVEKRAVRDSVLHAGAREVCLISEPIAAAIGADLPITKPQGNLIIDIGGGTTEIAIMSLSHIVVHNSIRVAGNKLDQDIVNYLRQKKNVFVGIQTAENIKIKIGSAYPLKQELTMDVRGRNIISGYPTTIRVTSEEIREAMSETVNAIIDAVSHLFEKTLPELSADIAERGLVLTGGGALLRGLDAKLKDIINLPAHVVHDPLTCVVRGTGKVLDNMEEFKDVLIKKEED